MCEGGVKRGQRWGKGGNYRELREDKASGRPTAGANFYIVCVGRFKMKLGGNIGN